MGTETQQRLKLEKQILQHKANNYCDRNDLGNPGRWYRRTKDEDKILGEMHFKNEQKTEKEMESDNRKKTRVMQVSRRQKWLCTDHVVQRN